jgi:hypothetical protein
MQLRKSSTKCLRRSLNNVASTTKIIIEIDERIMHIINRKDPRSSLTGGGCTIPIRAEETRENLGNVMIKIQTGHFRNKNQAIYRVVCRSHITRMNCRKINLFSGSHSGDDIEVALRVVTPCGLVGRYQRVGETYCLQQP